MATLEEIVVRVKADVSQLDRELKRVSGITRQETGKMSSALGALGGQFRALVPALSAAALVQFGKHALDAAGRMKDLADQIGFSAATLSALESGLATSGASLDQFAAAVNIMNANLGQAASGNQEMIKNFDALGLSVSKLQTLSPEEQFFAIVEALAGIEEQYKQTDIGRSIFGRGFAALLPIIKESNGQLAEFVKQQQELGKSLSEEQLNRLDDLGDSLSRVALTIRNDLLSAINDAIEGFLRLFNVGSDPSAADLQGKIQGLRDKLNVPEGQRARDRMGNVVDSDAAVNQQIKHLEGLLEVQQNLEAAKAKKPGTADPKGGNGDLLKPTGGGAKSAPPVPADYDSSAFQKYLADLNAEAEALGKSDRELAIRKALTEAQQAAQKDYADGLRDTSLLYEDEARQIENLAGGFYDLQRQMEDSRETNREWTRQLADGLTDIALNFDSASSAAEGFFKQIAAQILNKHITGPMSEGIMGLIGSGLGSLGGTTLYEGFGAGAASRTVGGLGDLFGGFFADGGTLKPGQWGIAGEDGPEPIFAGSLPLSVVPNSASGSTNNVTVVFNVSPGVQGTVEAEIRRAAPGIAQMAHNSVFQAIQRGGPERRIVRP